MGSLKAEAMSVAPGAGDGGCTSPPAAVRAQKGSFEIVAGASPTGATALLPTEERSKRPWCLAFLLWSASGFAWVVSIPVLLAALGGALAPVVGFPAGVAIALLTFSICVQIDQRVSTFIVFAASFSCAAWSMSVPALVAASVATWMTSLNAMRRTCAGCPRFVDWQCRTYARYHRSSSLGGALGSVRPGRSFFACHPHGILSVAWITNVLWNRRFHHTAGKCFYLIDKTLRNKGLLARIFCDAFEGVHGGFRDNSARTLRDLMAKGESVCMTPGAFHEATCFRFGEERVYLQERKGFVKYCLRYGYRLHPVYNFGEAETFHAMTGLESFRLWLNGYGIPTVAFCGLWWCPFMPRSDLQLRTFVGEPLELPKIDEPTDAQVAEWHGKYVAALRELFDRHKAEAGKPNAVLEIL